MAFKTFVIVFTLFVVVKCAPSPAAPCTCEDDQVYLEKFWEFYNSDTKAASDVAPGEISPLVYCSDCAENNRRKRKTEAEDKEDPEPPRKIAEMTEKNPRMLPESQPADYVDYNDDTKPGVEDPLCPAGTRRIGLWCA